ncbi:MAG TPA: arylsulfatase [Phycisphaerae bacterium]|nr:arylsulfatase [Phycisphaerae bacterium]
MNRRHFLKTVGAAAALAAAPRWPSAAHAAPARARPNVVFILADDMGYGDLACQNPNSQIPTPNLDALAKQGMRFTDAHSPSAVCTPTRYAVLTGRYCWRSQLKRGVLRPWGRPLIEPDRLTVPAMLRRHGYDTACIGKWHLGWDWRTADGEPVKVGSLGQGVDFTKPIADGPTTRGFDYYFGTAVPNYPPYCFIENDRTVGIPTKPKPKSMFGNPGPMLEGWDLVEILPALERKAVHFIESRAGQRPGRPFFLYMPLTAPHTPIAPAPEFRGKSRAGAYGDLVCQVDHVVGQVVAALDRNHLADDTLLIFTSDNGSPGRDGTDMSGPVNSVRRYGHNPSHIYRGIKADVWDGGHRVPFIARWPKHVPAGAANDEPICHVDLMGTLAAILGQDLPDDAGEDSYNILPALLGHKRDKPVREAIVHHSAGGMFAVRQGNWKLILGQGSGGWTRDGKGPDEPPGQLYDVAADPGEEKNLWRERPEVVERLTALLEQYKSQNRSRPL